MNRETMLKAMTTSTSEVLETMFFMSVDVVAPTAEQEFGAGVASEHVNAKLSFKGPVSGCMLLQVPALLAQEITADFLGVATSQVDVEQVAGTVMEMVNMLTGNTLSVYDSDAVFDLGVPRIVKGEQKIDEIIHAGEPIHINLDTLDSRIILTLACQA